MLAKGWISQSTLPYGHLVLFARKKYGALRLYVDYRSLSANTRVDRYPIPRIDELLDRLSVAGGFWAVILSRVVWKKSWVGHDPTRSIILTDRSVAITGDMARAQLLTA